MGHTCESRHNKESSIGNDQVLNQCKQTKNKIDNYIKALELKSKKAKEKAKECVRNKQKYDRKCTNIPRYNKSIKRRE